MARVHLLLLLAVLAVLDAVAATPGTQLRKAQLRLLDDDFDIVPECNDCDDNRVEGVELSLFKPPNTIIRHQGTSPGDSVPTGLRDLLVADFDADGRVDVIVSSVDWGGSVASWDFYKQSEVGSFDRARMEIGLPNAIRLGGAPHVSIVAHLDDDDLPDLVMCSGAGVYWFHNRGMLPVDDLKEQLTFDAYELDVTIDACAELQAFDVNNDGMTDIVVSGDEAEGDDGVFFFVNAGVSESLEEEQQFNREVFLRDTEDAEAIGRGVTARQSPAAVVGDDYVAVWYSASNEFDLTKDYYPPEEKPEPSVRTSDYVVDDLQFANLTEDGNDLLGFSRDTGHVMLFPSGKTDVDDAIYISGLLDAEDVAAAEPGVLVADFDADGINDIIAWSDDIVWVRNTMQGQKIKEEEIKEEEEEEEKAPGGAEVPTPALAGEGESTSGVGASTKLLQEGVVPKIGTMKPIDDSFEYRHTHADLADFDNDGDLDVVSIVVTDDGSSVLQVYYNDRFTLNDEWLIHDAAATDYLPEDLWARLCTEFFDRAEHDIEDRGWMVKVVMGEVVDLFRPINNETLCTMLVSNDKHLWTPELGGEGGWVKPPAINFSAADAFGGSYNDWPLDNVDGDDRRYLSLWGVNQGLAPGGCCASNYSSRVAEWGMPFKLYFKYVPSHIETMINMFVVPVTSGTNVTRAGWQSLCENLSFPPVLAPGVLRNDTRWQVRIEMGNVVDHFRPAPGYDLCDMLVSDRRHEFSVDGSPPWHRPPFHEFTHLGGSADYWPRNTIAGDNRRFLSFWGGGFGSLGCCHNEYTGAESGTPAWSKPFTMFFSLPQSATVYAPAPTPVPSPSPSSPTPVPSPSPTPSPTSGPTATVATVPLTPVATPAPPAPAPNGTGIDATAQPDAETSPPSPVSTAPSTNGTDRDASAEGADGDGDGDTAADQDDAVSLSVLEVVLIVLLVLGCFVCGGLLLCFLVTRYMNRQIEERERERAAAAAAVPAPAADVVVQPQPPVRRGRDKRRGRGRGRDRAVPPYDPRPHSPSASSDSDSLAAGSDSSSDSESYEASEHSIAIRVSAEGDSSSGNAVERPIEGHSKKKENVVSARAHAPRSSSRHDRRRSSSCEVELVRRRKGATAGGRRSTASSRRRRSKHGDHDAATLTGVARPRVDVSQVNIRKYGNKKKQSRGVAVSPSVNGAAGVVDPVNFCGTDGVGAGVKPRKTASRRRTRPRREFVSSESEFGWENSKSYESYRGMYDDEELGYYDEDGTLHLSSESESECYDEPVFDKIVEEFRPKQNDPDMSDEDRRPGSSTSPKAEPPAPAHQFVCPICRRVFPRKYNMQVHMQTHVNEKPFACDHCGRCFTQKSNLKRHVLTKHAHPWKCPLGGCNARFANKALVERHWKAAHPTEKPKPMRPIRASPAVTHSCACQAKFNSEGDLDAHRRACDVGQKALALQKTEKERHDAQVRAAAAASAERRRKRPHTSRAKSKAKSARGGVADESALSPTSDAVTSTNGRQAEETEVVNAGTAMKTVPVAGTDLKTDAGVVANNSSGKSPPVAHAGKNSTRLSSSASRSSSSSEDANTKANFASGVTSPSLPTLVSVSSSRSPSSENDGRHSSTSPTTAKYNPAAAPSAAAVRTLSPHMLQQHHHLNSAGLPLPPAAPSAEQSLARALLQHTAPPPTLLSQASNLDQLSAMQWAMAPSPHIDIAQLQASSGFFGEGGASLINSRPSSANSDDRNQEILKHLRMTEGAVLADQIRAGGSDPSMSSSRSRSPIPPSHTSNIPTTSAPPHSQTHTIISAPSPPMNLSSDLLGSQTSALLSLHAFTAASQSVASSAFSSALPTPAGSADATASQPPPFSSSSSSSTPAGTAPAAASHPRSSTFLTQLYELVRSSPRAAEKLKIFELFPQWRSAVGDTSKSRSPAAAAASAFSSTASAEGSSVPQQATSLSVAHNAASMMSTTNLSSPEVLRRDSLPPAFMSPDSAPSQEQHMTQMPSQNYLQDLQQAGASLSALQEQLMGAAMSSPPLADLGTNSFMSTSSLQIPQQVSNPSVPLMQNTISSPADASFASQALAMTGGIFSSDSLLSVSQQTAPALSNPSHTHPEQHQQQQPQQLQQPQHPLSLDLSATDAPVFKVPQHTRTNSLTSHSLSQAQVASSSSPTVALHAAPSLFATQHQRHQLSLIAQATSQTERDPFAMQQQQPPPPSFVRTTSASSVSASASAAVSNSRAMSLRSRSPSISLSRKTAESADSMSQLGTDLALLGGGDVAAGGATSAAIGGGSGAIGAASGVMLGDSSSLAAFDFGVGTEPDDDLMGADDMDL